MENSLSKVGLLARFLTGSPPMSPVVARFVALFSSSPSWDENAEARFQAWLRQKQAPFVRGVLAFLVFAVLVFGAWDFYLAPRAISHTWPLRLGAVVFLGVCAWSLRFSFTSIHWRALALCINSVLFCTLLLILVQLPKGPLLGVGGLLLSALLFRVHSPRFALACGIFNALATLGTYRTYDVSPRITANTELFLLVAAAGNILLNFSEDRGDRNLFALEDKLQRQATTDGLTGASNRRFFSARLDEEVARAGRYGQLLTLVLLDIDRFKAVNDSRGHGDGDIALKEVAAIGLATMRGSDTFARLGGEEFVALLPHADLEAGIALAERLRTQIEAHPIRGDSGEFVVTASFGVATLSKGEGGETLVARADAALYLAKHSGRNCVQSETNLQTRAREVSREHER